MSDTERDQQDETTATEYAKEDLELKDEDADQVRGGIIIDNGKTGPKKP